MFMPCLIFKRIYFSIMGGGGVRGKDVGTDHIITTEVGCIIAAYRLLTGVSIRAGEMISESICGKDSGGTIGACPIKNFNAIGVAGKETGIGNETDGEYKDHLLDINPEI